MSPPLTHNDSERTTCNLRRSDATDVFRHDAKCGGVSVIIPIKDAEGTITRALDSLLVQACPLSKEILVLDDGSVDRSVELVMSHPCVKVMPVRVLPNKQGGLAAAYNQGWHESQYDVLVFMHQDCYVEDRRALSGLLEPFASLDVVAAMSCCTLQRSAWDAMSFWDKVASARYLGREEQMFQGKFDAVRRSAMDAVSGYDAARFRGAGEDLDLLYRLRQIGEVVKTKIAVVHAHRYPPNAKVVSLFRKQRQLGEGLGALIRKHSLRIVTGGFFPIFVGHGFKLGLFVLLLVPSLRLWAFLSLIGLGCFYSSRALCQRDVRIVFVPFVHVLLFATFLWSVGVGFLRGRQSYDYFGSFRKAGSSSVC